MGFFICATIANTEISHWYTQPFSTLHPKPEGSLQKGKKTVMKESMAWKEEHEGEMANLKSLHGAYVSACILLFNQRPSIMS